jgi:hypothetical protein
MNKQTRHKMNKQSNKKIPGSGTGVTPQASSPGVGI